MNACSPAANDAVEAVEDAAADVVEDPEADDRTEATWTRDVLVEVLDDVAADVVDEEAVDAINVLIATTGVGGASKRMNIAKLVMSELKSDAGLLLWPASVVLTVSCGSGAVVHCAEADGFRSSGNRSLVMPSSAL